MSKIAPKCGLAPSLKYQLIFVCPERARCALEKSPVLLLQLLERVAIAQITAKIRNNLLPGTPALHAQTAPRVGTTAEDVTPADHMIALASGVACCIEAFSV